ncbi:hypothetical protein, partial [Dehalococcoides sp.]|uniref:hypothetical protein n=1 Tax=Dehalococcoides sp. TaxID=1966486 RepID=UPI002ACB0C3D
YLSLEGWTVLPAVLFHVLLPSYLNILGAKLSLSYLSSFWGPPQLVVYQFRLKGNYKNDSVGILPLLNSKQKNYYRNLYPIMLFSYIVYAIGKRNL